MAWFDLSSGWPVVASRGTRASAEGSAARPVSGTYSERVFRFRDRDPARHARWATELIDKAARSKHPATALMYYDRVVSRYGRVEPTVRVHDLVARAWVNKGIQLAALGRSSDAL